MSLWVHEIFESISGEVGGFPQGARAVFVRLGGCNLRCDYCDTPDTQGREKSNEMPIKLIMEQICAYQEVKNVLITGGEPLLQQKGVILLCQYLAQMGKRVGIETNGTIRVPKEILLMKNVTIIMDYKLDLEYSPHFNDISEEKAELQIKKTYGELRSTDFIKFVVKNPMEIALAAQIQNTLSTHAQFAYSPVIDINGGTKAEQLAMFQLNLQGMAAAIMTVLREMKLNALISVQIHKILNLA